MKGARVLEAEYRGEDPGGYRQSDSITAGRQTGALS